MGATASKQRISETAVSSMPVVPAKSSGKSKYVAKEGKASESETADDDREERRVCFHCEKPGHIVKNCPEFKKSKKAGKKDARSLFVLNTCDEAFCGLVRQVQRVKRVEKSRKPHILVETSAQACAAEMRALQDAGAFERVVQYEESDNNMSEPVEGSGDAHEPSAEVLKVTDAPVEEPEHGLEFDGGKCAEGEDEWGDFESSIPFEYYLFIREWAIPEASSEFDEPVETECVNHVVAETTNEEQVL